MKRTRLTRTQWAQRLSHLAKNAPPVPDDVSTAQLLLDVVVAEQANIADESLAVLSGLAAVFCHRGMAGMTPRHVDGQGRPVFTEDQVAERIGVPVEVVRERVDALVGELGDEAGICAVAPESLQPLN